MAGGKWAEVLHAPNTKMRQKAAFTLGNIGPSDPTVLPALIRALNDADAGVRCEAILALLKYGSGAEQAISQLAMVQKKDRDAKVRAYAAKALENLQESK
jgi:hypothetical protein